MLFVAEIGMNYDGNLDLAHELIRQAKRSGADIAKFQFGWRDKPGEINFLDNERVEKLKTWCDYWEIEMMASVITEEGLKLAHHVGLKRYKIAARTVIDRPDLVKRVLSEGKETFISLGMWDKDEFPFGPPDDHRVRYLYCRSKYPAYPADLKTFPAQFTKNGFYGYSDHLQGIEACVLAVSRGAQYIEKHFTLNKTSTVIRDHALSATPGEFQTLVDVGSVVAKFVQAIGPGVKIPQEIIKN
jgi:N,N'-diacetyllegionaminate synthase